MRVVARDGGDEGIKGRRARLDFGKQLTQRTTRRDRHKKSRSEQLALAAAVKDINGSSKNGGSPWQLQKRLSSLEKSAINEVHPQQWIVDSGASHHLTKERPNGQLRPFRKQVSGVGGTVDITGLGTYGRLTDVRYAPGQSLNLCSVRQLIETTDINTVVFTRDHAIAMGGTTRSNRFTIKIGRRVGRLYYLTKAAFNDDSNQGDTAAATVQTEARPPVLHEPDPSDEQTSSATTSPGTSISVAGNPDDHIDQQQLSRAVPLSHVGMPEGHQSLPKTRMRSRVDTSLTSQNTPTPLPITGQDVGSLDIDANESDITRDERGNGTRRYETSFSTASEGLLARADVLSTRADDGNWANDGKQPMSTTVSQVNSLPGGADAGNWADDGKKPMSTTVTQLNVPCRKKSKKHQVIDRWHQRLFHAAPKRLKQLAAAGLLPGVIPEDFKGYSTDTCEACLYGKMSKRPVPNKSRSKVRATRPGELIHCDIFGPSQVATISGRHRYFITFIDDFSGHLWLYLLKGRSDAAVALRRFAEDFQVATRGLRAMYYVIDSYVPGVQRIRTDNAGELVGDMSPFALFLKNAKIQHEYSCPHVHQQNGVAERANRTIACGIRTALAQANLPTTFWGYAAKAHVVAMNHSPRRTNPSNKTPMQMWPKGDVERPTIAMLRVFGSRVWSHLDKEQRINGDKLSRLSEKGIMVGYVNGMNAWKIYFPDKKMALARYHVKFDENMPTPSPTQPMVLSWKTPSHPFWDAGNKEEKGRNSEDTKSTLHLGHKVRHTSASDAPADSMPPRPPAAPETSVAIAPEVSAGPASSVIPTSGDGGNGATDAPVPRQPEDQQPELDDGPDLISPPTKASSEELTAYWKKHGTKEEAWKLQPEKDLWISRGLQTTRKFNDGIWYTGKVTHIAIQKGKAQYGITYDDDNTTWFHHAGFIKKAHTNYAHRIGKTPHADRDGDDSDPDDSGSLEDSTTAPVFMDGKDSVVAISLEDSETEGMDRTADLCKPHMHLYLQGWYRQVPWQMAYNINGLASDILEPKTYGEACDHKLSDHWKKAIKKEFGVMLTFDVWEVTPRSKLPPGVRPISTTWVFKAKPNADGTIERLKARLCARGFLQQYGKDFLNTFAPVARLSTIRLQVALSGRFGLKMRHLDFKSAFLQGKLDIPLYQELPEGWEDFLVPLLAEKGTKLQSTDVLRLKRGIYGLKQAAQLWYVALVKGLLECGFKQSKSDTCLFTMIDNKSSDVILITTWVDDCIVSYNNPKQWERILKMICGKFVLGSGTDFEWCLGMAVDRDMEKGTVCLHQSLYVRNLLKRFNMEDARIVRTPADSNVTLSKEMSPQTKREMSEMERIPYRSLLGALLHLANFTRPDIACAVSICSRYANNYGPAHWQALKRILRYLRGTIDQKTGKSPGLLYDKRVSQDKPVIGYVDSDFARCPDSRKSMLGYVFICCGGPIQWKATKQSLIAASTAEAEYIALSEAAKEAIWLRKLLKDFQIPVGAIPLYEDNQACIKILENPVYHARTKHIGIKVHLVRDYFEKGEIVVPYISTHEQLADIFTKPLPKATFEKFASRLVHWAIHRPWNNSKDITTLERRDSPTPSSSKTVGALKTRSPQSSTTQRRAIVSV